MDDGLNGPMDEINKWFGDPAKVKYGSPQIEILREGFYVRCAVTDEVIYIDDLRYWSVERQEPYASADISWKRELEYRGKV